MKKIIIEVVVVALVIFALVLGVTMFIQGNADVLKWSTHNRGGVVGVWVCILIWYLIVRGLHQR